MISSAAMNNVKTARCDEDIYGKVYDLVRGFQKDE